MSRESKRRFQFIREIASGGFGGVYLCKLIHNDGFSRLAAVKLLHRRWSENEEIARRMRDEARLLGWLRHRNIVDVVDLTSIDGRAAVVMEYLEAVDLKNMVVFLGDSGELLPPRVALEMMGSVSSALDAAYNRPPYPGEKPLRVIHRDIKPSNIMVDESGLVKVLDFGVARADFDTRESHTRELQFGSVDYMPPERLFFEPETPASDVYSLGASIFEVLTLDKLGKAKGRPERHARFLADRMSFMRASLAVPPKTGSEVEQLLTRCLSFEHQDRPSAAEVVKQARVIARALPGASLLEWSEDRVPELLKRSQALKSDTPANPMAGRVLEEDSQVFVGPPRTDEVPAPVNAPSSFEQREVGPALSANPTIVPDGDDLPLLAKPNQSLASLDAQDAQDDAATQLQRLPKRDRDATQVETPTPEQDVEPSVAKQEPVPKPPRELRPPVPTPSAPRPMPAPPPTLPRLEPSMDDWDDVPTRIETMASLAEKAASFPAVPTPVASPPAVPTPPPAAHHDEATQVFGKESGVSAATTLFEDLKDDETSFGDNDAATRIVGQAPPPPPTVSAVSPPASAPLPPAPLPTAPPPVAPAPPPRPEPVQKSPPVATDGVEEAQPFETGPTPPPPPREKKKSKLPMLAGVCCGLIIALIVCGGGAYYGSEYLASGGVFVPSLEPPVDLDPAPDLDEPEPPIEPELQVAVEPEPVVEAEPEAAVVSGIQFTSLDPETKKLTVTCVDGSVRGAKGERTVTVDLEQDAKCLVVAIMNDRSRRQVSVEPAQKGVYQCFAPGAAKDLCER